MKVDVRLVSASNVDLEARVETGEFRPDLLDRLSFEVITLPPLREREGDALLLAHLFAARMAQELGLDQTPTFTPAEAEALARHPWPGNVRELKNTVERAIYQGVALDPKPARGEAPGRKANGLESPSAEDGPAPADEGPDFPWPEGEFDRRTAAYALGLFQEALARARHNQREAARLLGLTYHRFRFLHKKCQ
jgi:psp operon transcriptional activator